MSIGWGFHGFSVSRRARTGVVVLAMLLWWAEATTAGDGRINVDASGVAIRGYDPVAYFTAGEPRRGSPEYTYRWRDTSWWFCCDENRRAFMADPRRYAPQFGGFCAYAASYGRFADADPHAWSIVDGRLYLNFNRRAQAIWRPRAEEFIGDAEQLWPRMRPD